MTTTTAAGAPLTLEVMTCDDRFWITVQFDGDPDTAGANALDYFRRKAAQYARPDRWGGGIGRPILTSDGPISDALADYLFPTCVHGMSADLCADPVNHYPSDRALY